ncbi:TonB-dependent receptor [Aurantiacibacter xanthus]|uniref:TonB-dependent receptor n=1 Tax=Aurantiacibacter xanthus TaxID=1784712 RepID=A0A3A1PJ91_9SPHN|nr:TonB-dependent receptor [Aurantiacibacter xanthus]RIV92883.1 TonB-dependent receptor [Aurantiacibacter xanthus]
MHNVHLFTRAALLASVAAVTGFAAPAIAQDAALSTDDVIIVTGSIRQSQQASIAEKRQAPNLADIAAADSVGRFPDQNSAAALSRLPAVAVQRDQGQERYIQVRGAPNRWTSVSIDGIPLTGVDEGGDSRAFRFDAVPAVALSRMVVNKSLTADQQADAIVATIDLQTYSPMDRRGLQVSGDLGYGWMGLGDGEQRQGSIRAGWANDTIGVMAGASHYRRDQLTDNREVGLYDSLGPTEFDIRQYKLERWSNSYFGGIEIDPSDDLRLWVKGIYTEFNDDEQRNQYELRLDRAAAGTRGFSSGELYGVPLRGSFNYGEYRNENYIGTFGADYEALGGFSASLRLNYTKTKNDTYLPLVQSSTSGFASPSITYDASDPRFPIVTLYGTIDSATPGNPPVYVRGPELLNSPQNQLSVAGAYMIDARQATDVDAYTGRLDLAQEFDSGLTLKGGLYYVDRQIDGNNFSFANIAALGALGGRVGQPFDVNSYVTNVPWDTRFPLGFTLNYVDNEAMRADIDSLLVKLEDAGLFDPAKSIPASDRYAQAEKIYAGYVSGEYEMDALTIIAGLRVEHYKMENSGTVITSVQTPITVDQSYTDFFPSVNLRYEATNNLVLRLAGQRGISRPAYGAIRVGASINDTASPGTISGGNPGLRPEYTWGVDASAEYYLPTNGIVSVTGFYRWVDNVFFSGAEILTGDTYDFGGVDRTGYLLSGTFNGKNGKLYGVELNAQNQFDFLPSPLDGLGVQGNVTFLGGTFDAPATATQPAQSGLPFQGLSDTIANASVFYEKYGFSARVSYQWRSDWEDTLGGLGAGESRKGYENLDVSLRYSVNDYLTLFADLANLTDEYYIAYTGGQDKPSEVEQIGSRYLFGVRFDF